MYAYLKNMSGRQHRPTWRKAKPEQELRQLLDKTEDTGYKQPGVLAAEQAARVAALRGAGDFKALGLSISTLKAIIRMGYVQPTPIQRLVIRSALAGNDVTAMARTGSGKTAAFLLPVIERLKTHSTIVGVRAVIVCPTRELGIQTARFFRGLCRYNDLRLALIVGGSSMEKQFESLSENPDVIIATPGRLVQQLVETEMSLMTTQILVLDEADRLFELGTDDQIAKIFAACGTQRQVLLLTATMPDPVVHFAETTLRNPHVIRLDIDRSVSDKLDLWFLSLRSEQKLGVILYLIQRITKGEKVLLFVSTRHHVDFFLAFLAAADVESAGLYGTMDAEIRAAHLEHFSSGKTQVMVVTDVAARGLDLPDVKFVINFDFPGSPKLFIHRVGRTARAERSGTAISLVTPSDLPHTMELMLRLGRQLKLPNSQPQVKSEVPEASPPAPCMYIGGVPSLDDQVEFARQIIASDPDITRLSKSVAAAHKLYVKSRPAASSHSVRRAKEFVQVSGGLDFIRQSMHPALLATPEGRQESEEVGRRLVLESLRAFRPNSEEKVISGKVKVGTCVIPTEIVEKMKTRKLVHQWMEGMETGRRAMRLKEEARGDDLFKSLNQGEKLGASGKFQSTKFFMTPLGMDTAEEASTTSATTALRQLREAALNLTPDDTREMQKRSRQVRKWDPKKKRYTMVEVDSRSGELVKRNEAGVKVRGEVTKSGLFKKWSKETKKRIQMPNEPEDAANAPVPPWKRQKTVEQKEKPKLEDMTRDLALIEAVRKGWKLTNKQKRNLNKLQRRANAATEE